MHVQVMNSRKNLEPYFFERGRVMICVNLPYSVIDFLRFPMTFSVSSPDPNMVPQAGQKTEEEDLKDYLKTYSDDNDDMPLSRNFDSARIPLAEINFSEVITLLKSGRITFHDCTAKMTRFAAYAISCFDLVAIVTKPTYLPEKFLVFCRDFICDFILGSFSYRLHSHWKLLLAEGVAVNIMHSVLVDLHTTNNIVFPPEVDFPRRRRTKDAQDFIERCDVDVTSDFTTPFWEGPIEWNLRVRMASYYKNCKTANELPDIEEVVKFYHTSAAMVHIGTTSAYVGTDSQVMHLTTPDSGQQFEQINTSQVPRSITLENPQITPTCETPRPTDPPIHTLKREDPNTRDFNNIPARYPYPVTSAPVVFENPQNTFPFTTDIRPTDDYRSKIMHQDEIDRISRSVDVFISSDKYQKFGGLSDTMKRSVADLLDYVKTETYGNHEAQLG